MTVIRLECGLVVHSPRALTADLEAEVERLGPPRWIVGPNRIHYWWIPEWREAFPKAEVWLAPRIRGQAGRRIDLGTRTLPGDRIIHQDRDIATLPFDRTHIPHVELLPPPDPTLMLPATHQKSQPDNGNNA